MNNKYKNHETAGKANCQAQYINNDVGFMTENISESSLEEIAKHNSFRVFN
jgi:hypothetical protein